MLVFHLGWEAGTFLLWGEKGIEGALSASGRGRVRVEVRPHPFAAPGSRLVAALPAGVRVAVRRGRKRVIWLPGKRALPLPSDPVLADLPPSRAAVRLLPWEVSTVPMSLEEAIPLFTAARGKRVLAPGIVVGTDLAWWTELFHFALSLVVRQRYLPDLGGAGEGYPALWRPIFLGSDMAVRLRFARSMPACARAFAEKETSSLPERSPEEIVVRFLTEVTDRLVRESVTPKRRGRRRPSFDSSHDAWFTALQQKDRALSWADPEGLRREIVSWKRPLAISANAPFRLAFLLEEPEPVSGPGRRKKRAWALHPLLQSLEDPSLRIPVGAAWKSKGPYREILQQNGFHAKAFVLSALGEAARFSPLLASGLDTGPPGTLWLTAGEAYRFMTEEAPLLEEGGFGVLLPVWWTPRGSRNRLVIHGQVQSPKFQGTSGLQMTDLIAFDWKVALGDEAVTLSELERLARLKEPLVQFRGMWVELRRDELDRAIAFVKQKIAGKATVREALEIALGARSPDLSLPVGKISVTGAFADLLERLRGEAALQPLPPPEGFQGTLRPYQERGYAWLDFLARFGLGACLADDMGLGKTVQTLAFLQRKREEGETRPVLLICPTSVVNNWRKEAQRFTPGLSLLVHHGIQRKKADAFIEEARKHAIVVSSYNLLQRDIAFLGKIEWAGVILDEAQNVKNPETKQSKAARSLKADFKIALTGTPVENNVGDLWAIMAFLNPGFLGSEASFRRRFFLPIQREGDLEAAERLRAITGPFILRRLKTDRTIIADLPEKQEMKVYCSLTKEQASLYTAVVRDTAGQLEEEGGIKRKGIILATLLKLKQVCNHPAQFLHDGSSIPERSGKLARLTEMLEEVLSVGERSLIFTQFAEMGEILKKHLQETFGYEALFLHGGVPKRQRDALVERFQQEKGGPPFFILSLKAGGTGLNLTRANHVFHFDRWWNPAVENQATDRAFRIGQKKNVQVHKFICAGTLEERIDRMIERKLEIAKNVVGTGEGWITELSNRELLELFQLRRDAIGE